MPSGSFRRRSRTVLCVLGDCSPSPSFQDRSWWIVLLQVWPPAAGFSCRPLLSCQVTTPTTNLSVRSSGLSVLRPFLVFVRLRSYDHSESRGRRSVPSFCTRACISVCRYRHSAPGECSISCYPGRGLFCSCITFRFSIASGRSVCLSIFRLFCSSILKLFLRVLLSLYPRRATWQPLPRPVLRRRRLALARPPPLRFVATLLCRPSGTCWPSSCSSRRDSLAGSS